MGKPGFGRSCSVAIWCTDHYLHLKMTYASPNLRTSMVRSSIHQKYDFVSPGIRELFGKGLTQSREKHHHYILISIALRQWYPNISFRWNSNDHIDPMTHDSFCHGVIFSLGNPSPSSEVSLRYPSLINIYDMLSLVVDLKHFLGIQWTQYFILFGIAPERNPLDLTIA